MKKKKSYNLFDEVVEHGVLTAGTMGMAGVVSKIGSSMPSQQSGAIQKGMSMVAVIPTVNAARISLKSVSMLSDTLPKYKKKKYKW